MCHWWLVWTSGSTRTMRSSRQLASGPSSSWTLGSLFLFQRPCGKSTWTSVWRMKVRWPMARTNQALETWTRHTRMLPICLAQWPLQLKLRASLSLHARWHWPSNFEFKRTRYAYTSCRTRGPGCFESGPMMDRADVECQSHQHRYPSDRYNASATHTSYH